MNHGPPPGGPAALPLATGAAMNQTSPSSPPQVDPARRDSDITASVAAAARAEYDVWGTDTPYSYQVECFIKMLDPVVALRRFHATGCYYAKQLLIQGTGRGKSRYGHVLATALGGCTLFFAPLIMLGNDQAKKILEQQFKEAVGPVNVIHLDEYKSIHGAEIVRLHLQSLPTSTDGRATTIIVSSPQAIAGPASKKYGFAKMLVDLRDAGKLPLVIIDEVHYFMEQGLIFRWEFCDLRGDLWCHLFPPDDPACHPRLVMMTATFNYRRFQFLETMLGFTIPPFDIEWAHPEAFDRSNINITASYGASTLASSKNMLKENLASADKAMFYTNARYAAIERADKLESLFDDESIDKDVILVHGNQARADKLHWTQVYIGQFLSQYLPNPDLLVVTQGVAGAGIDLQDAEFVNIDNLPPSPAAFYQLIGRAAPLVNPAPLAQRTSITTLTTLHISGQGLMMLKTWSSKHPRNPTLGNPLFLPPTYARVPTTTCCTC